MKTLPKVELHLHLDCSLSYQAVSTLAPSVTREEYETDYRAPAKCANLAEFLSRAPRGVLLMQSEQALQLAVEDLFQQLVEDGIVYAEIRFAPMLHTERGLSPERAVETVDAALERMISATGLGARLILCSLRHFTPPQSMTTARLVEQFRGSRVVALDLAGDEAGFPIDAHMAAFRCAREQGCLRTAHAGEACGPPSVWDTMRELQPTRIGHGVRSIEDDSLIEYLRKNQIHLEVCPSANVQIIESIHRWQDHPIDRLYRAGLSLNVNTDCRTLTPVTLTDEYERLSRYFGWTQADFLRTNLMGLRAAFLDEAEKTHLSAKLQAAYAG
jgi:adenosine deaminase